MYDKPFQKFFTFFKKLDLYQIIILFFIKRKVNETNFGFIVPQGVESCIRINSLFCLLFFQLYVKPAVKMEVNVSAPTSVHVCMVFKEHCVKMTLMNVPWGPVCTNAPQIPHVSISLDGKGHP